MTRARRISLVALACAAALGLAACGGGDDAGDEPAASGEPEAAADADSPFDRDPCELLDEADVEELLGEAVEGEATPGNETTFAPAQCVWSTGEPVDPVGAGANPSAISLFLGDAQIFANTRMIAEGGDDFAEIDGVGDAAYAGNGEGGVLIGSAGITVTPIGVNINDPGTHELIADVLTRVAAAY